MLQKGKTDWAP